MKTIQPETTHGIIHHVKGSLYGYQGWPTVAKDEYGTLYAVVSGFRVQHICPFGKTVMHISKNNGQTWTPPIVINDTYMDDRDAGILYLGNGKLIVSWFTHSPEEYTKRYRDWIVNNAGAAQQMVIGALDDYITLPLEEQVGGSYIRISNDYGVTWGDIIRVPVSAPHGPNVMKDGTLIYFGNKMYQDKIHIGDSNTDDWLAFYASLDGGYTWEERHVFAFPDWAAAPIDLCEPHVIELPNGRLYGMIRIDGVGKFSIATTYSDDGGYTWSSLVDTGVKGAPPHLLLHSSGALICSFGRRSEPYGEYAMVSYDLGETWIEEYAIDTQATDGDLGYPATVELNDGSLMTVYYQKLPGEKKTSLLYTKWNLEK